MTTIFVTFGLLILEVWILAGIAIGLHYLSSRYGVSLLLMYAAAIIGIITFANPTTVFVEPVPDIILTLPGDFFVPTILVIVLVLYVVDGTEIAQAVIFGIALIQLLVAFIFFIISATAYLPQATSALVGVSFTDILQVNLQVMGAGVVAFIADMFVIAIIYQGVQNIFQHRMNWLAVALALVGALWTDAIMFNVLSSIGRGGFTEFIAGDIVSKSIAALSIFPIVALYLNRFAPTLPGDEKTRYRPAFDIVHNLFGDWRFKIVHLESELREKEINTHELIANINQIFWIADEQSVHAHFISPAFDRLLSVSRGTFYLTPDSLTDIVHPDEQEIIGRWLCYEGTSHDIEFRVKGRDGGDMWVRDRTYHVEDEELNIKRVIGITENITDLKERQQLETAITVEREKIQILHELVREVSHDIQSPISAMTLKIDLIDRVKNDGKRRKKYLKDLKRQTFHLSQMIERLFTLMKVESQSNLLQDISDVNTLCQDAVDEAYPLAEEKHLTIDLNLTTVPMPIQCTVTDMRRVFNNLITNAIRYTPEEGTITITTDIDIEEDRAKVSITDTGIGISEDDLPHIFERFYRATNTDDIEGTGLGLAITRQIIQQHNGDISVESELNTGTTFTVYLPLTK